MQASYDLISHIVLQFNNSLNYFSVDLRFPQHVTNGARDIISKLLKYQPEDRLDLKSILHHEWVQQHLTSEVRSK